MPQSKQQPEPERRPARQEEKNELFACLLKAITPLIKEWIDQADIEVEEGYSSALKTTYKWLNPSWRKPYRDLGTRKFLWADGVFQDDLAIAAFVRMVQVQQEEEDNDEVVLEDKERSRIVIRKGKIEKDEEGNTFIRGELVLSGLKNIKGAKDVQGTEATWLLEQRLKINARLTGHPFHHQTADATIIEPDPTVEYLLSTMPADDKELILERWRKRIEPDAPEATPVDLWHYGFYSGFDSE
jgi:hypothetical protein